MVAVEAFQIFMTAQLCDQVWLNICFDKSSNTGLFDGVIRNLLLVCVTEFVCSKVVFEELADLIFSEGSVEIPYFCRLVFVGDLWRDKKEDLVQASLRNGDF